MLTENQPKSKADTKLPEILENHEHGMSNTMLNPVDIPAIWKSDNKDVLSYPHKRERIERDDVRYFVDWVTYFGQGMRLPLRVEDFLVHQFIEGKFFHNPNSTHADLLDYQKIERTGQIAPKSSKTWNYSYRNTLGIELFICLDDDGLIDAIKIDFSGSPLSVLIPRNNLLKLVEMLDLLDGVSPKFNPSRIDITCEVSHDLIDILELKKHADLGNFSGVGKIKPEYENDRKTGLLGLTLNCGSTKSKKKLRIYETTNNHGYSGIRFELQNHSYRAIQIKNMFVNEYKCAIENDCMDAKNKTKLASEINNIIRDLIFNIKTINFVYKDSIKIWKSAKQYKEIPSWTKFKEDLQVVQYKYKFCPNKLTNIQKKNSWLFKNIRYLCAVQLTFGEQGVLKLIRGAIKRKLEGVGVKPFGSNNSDKELLNEITTYGYKFWGAGFDPNLRKDLREIGFYDEPLPRKNKEFYPFIEIMDFNLYPTQYRESIIF